MDLIVGFWGVGLALFVFLDSLVVAWMVYLELIMF